MSIITPTSILRFMTLKKYKFKGKIIHHIAEKSLHRFLNFVHLWEDYFCTNEAHSKIPLSYKIRHFYLVLLLLENWNLI